MVKDRVLEPEENQVSQIEALRPAAVDVAAADVVAVTIMKTLIDFSVP